MRTIIPTILAAAVIAATPATAAPRDPDATLAKLLDGRVAGKPVNCISLFRNLNSRIIPGTAVVYGSGDTIWVNRPRAGASSLDADDILVTKTIGDQLCSLDGADLIDRGSRQWRGFVTFDQFVPYTLAHGKKSAS